MKPTRQTVFKQQRNMLLVIALSLFTILPFPALANHGLEALGALADFIAKILLVVYSINLLLSIGNIFWKSTVIRVLNIIACIPAALVIALVLNDEPVNALIPIVVLVIQCFIISKSIPKKTYTLPDAPTNSYLPPDEPYEQHN